MPAHSMIRWLKCWSVKEWRSSGAQTRRSASSANISRAAFGRVDDPKRSNLEGELRMNLSTAKILALYLILGGLLYADGRQSSATDTPRPEYPRPEMVRADWLNLNGWWDFALDLTDTGEEREYAQGKGFDKKIRVPFAPESPLSGIGNLDFMTAVWYKRTFVLPETWLGRRVLIHFEACDYKTTVWLNGQRVGDHLGGYTPFSFDLTAHLQSG